MDASVASAGFNDVPGDFAKARSLYRPYLMIKVKNQEPAEQDFVTRIKALAQRNRERLK